MDIPPGRVIATTDTTGAGDTLLSAYLQALERQAEPPDALRQAVQSVETSIEEGIL